MNIPINKNIDEYKDDVYKGLSTHQIIYSVAVLGIGVAAFLLVKYYFHVPMILTVMVTAIVTMPVAFIGFMPICRMPVPEYLKKRKKVIENNTFIYETISYRCSDPDRKKKTHKKGWFKKKSKAQVFLDELYLDSIDEKGKEASL